MPTPVATLRLLRARFAHRFGRSLVTSLLLATTALTCTGCPELNRWSGPNEDPFFSVADEDRHNRQAQYLTDNAEPAAVTASLAEDAPPEIADAPSAPEPGRPPARHSRSGQD